MKSLKMTNNDSYCVPKELKTVTDDISVTLDKRADCARIVLSRGEHKRKQFIP